MEDEESHSLSQETECPGDMFFLIIKNIPSNTVKEIIEIHVENVTEDENMKLEIEFNDTGDQALLSFQQCESGPEEVIEKLKLKSTELLKYKLEIDIPPSIKNRLLVRNIRPDADKMMLVLHFESPKFNPNGNIEVEVEFSAPKKAAIVILPDSVDVSTFVSGNVDHSFLGPEVVVEKCTFFTCLESIESTSGARGGEQNSGRRDREGRPERNRGPRKNRDHDFSDNSSDQGTTERLEQEIDQSGKFWGRRGDSGGKGAAAGTNVADKDVHEGLDEETDLEYVKKN